MIYNMDKIIQNQLQDQIKITLNACSKKKKSTRNSKVRRQYPLIAFMLNEICPVSLKIHPNCWGGATFDFPSCIWQEQQCFSIKLYGTLMSENYDTIKKLQSKSSSAQLHKIKHLCLYLGTCIPLTKQSPSRYLIPLQPYWDSKIYLRQSHLTDPDSRRK